MFEIGADAKERKPLTELEHYTLTKAFLDAPERFLMRLEGGA